MQLLRAVMSGTRKSTKVQRFSQDGSEANTADEPRCKGTAWTQKQDNLFEATMQKHVNLNALPGDPSRVSVSTCASEGSKRASLSSCASEVSSKRASLKSCTSEGSSKRGSLSTCTSEASQKRVPLLTFASYDFSDVSPTCSKHSSPCNSPTSKRGSLKSNISTVSTTSHTRSSRGSISSTASSITFGDIMPDFLNERDEWFNYWDAPEHGGSGSEAMSQKQVVRMLTKTFPEHEKKEIEAIVREVWGDFDNANGGIDLGKDTLMKPQLGLIDTVHMVLGFSS